MNAKNIYCIINFLSMAKIFCGMFTLTLLTQQGGILLLLAFITMLAAELSNFLSWRLSCKLIQTERFEVVFAFASTKIYHTLIYTAFLSNKWCSLWLVLTIYFTELFIPYIKILMIQQCTDIPPRLSGKITTTVHALVQLCIVGIAMEMNGNEMKPTASLVFALFYVAGFASIVHLIDVITFAVRK